MIPSDQLPKQGLVEEFVVHSNDYMVKLSSVAERS